MKHSILYLPSLFMLGLYLSFRPVNKSTGDSDENPVRPNIIFLLTDDQRWNAMGFMGNEYVITPNLDYLADQSVSFTNAYHVAPICMPSRSSIMTGKYLGTHGSGFDRPTNYIITEEEFNASYPALLRKAGYYTGFIGKFGFCVYKGSEKVIRKGCGEESMPKDFFDVWNGFIGQGQYRPREDGTFNGYENKWNAAHLTEFMGYQADEFIQKAKSENKPFCLSISFKAPHGLWDPEEQFRRLYNNRNIPRMINDDPRYFAKLPKVVQEKSRNAAWYFGKHMLIAGQYYWPDLHIAKDSTYQAFIKNYYALITGADYVVGLIRHKLNELGIAGNTVIIFTSDNGYFNGSKQLMGKALLYEESIKAPMIVYDPRYMKDKKGRKEKGLISIIDIAPTILDLAGIEKPGDMPGKSFMPIVYDETEEIHDAVYGEDNFTEYFPVPSEVENPDDYQSVRSKFVRTKDFKYIRYQECHPVVEELFKISEDTLETDNLINDPAYSDVVRKMRGKLDAFEKEFVKY